MECPSSLSCVQCIEKKCSFYVFRNGAEICSLPYGEDSFELEIMSPLVDECSKLTTTTTMAPSPFLESCDEWKIGFLSLIGGIFLMVLIAVIIKCWLKKRAFVSVRSLARAAIEYDEEFEMIPID